MIPGQLGPTRRDFDWLIRAWWTWRKGEYDFLENIAAVTYLDLVLLGDTLSDADNQANLVLNGLDNGVSSSWWRDIENGCVGFDFAHSLAIG